MSTIRRLYHRLYGTLCGTHPGRRFWHAQWLSVKDLYRELRRVLGGLQGRVLDIGCGDKPYERWLVRAAEHVGIDVRPGPRVDHVIKEGADWPFAPGHFQAVIATQVIQHVADLPGLISRIDAVLAPDGTVVLSFPFCYNDMTVDFDTVHVRDYWRFSVHGARKLFADDYEVLEARALGGVGSTIGVMWLNWLSSIFMRNQLLELVFFLALPIWIVGCVLVNAVGFLLDAVDDTASAYHDVLLVVRKRSAGEPGQRAD